ncbi:MAG: SulP family inorganic anion transporter [Phycisphaerales bacterium]
MSRYTPKLLVCLREGYTPRAFLGDLGAGVTVAVIALPLAMALGIASIPQHVAEDLRAIHPWLSPPAMGLYTAIIAGFLISAVGGSRVQIGGPTAAFIPIVAAIASTHGYEGLATATLMAGVLIILMGLFRFGAMIKFIPYPVTTGFTAGIAVIIVASQLRDFFGLTGPGGATLALPPEFIPKLQLLARHADSISWQTTAVGAGSLAILILFRRFVPRIPGAIVAVALSSAAVYALGLDKAAGGGVATIGSVFGSLPSSLPAPHLPAFSFAMVGELIPSAVTIALLCAIESLLSAVVADGMTGQRHKSDAELVAQGVANIGSVFFFGLPATGAIARTVANIKSGGRTPIAGIIHAACLLGFMLLLAPLAKTIPLAALASILLVVAWNISEIDHFRSLLRAPKSDVAVLLTTFGLTVFTDLTIAVTTGMVIASMLFMKRMADVSGVQAITREFQNGSDDAERTDPIGDPKDPRSLARRDVPPGIEVFEINGPFFFGVADRLKDTLNQFERPPRIFILRMRLVPAMDATGMHALEEFHRKCHRQGIRLLLAGVHAQPLFAMTNAGLDRTIGVENMFENLDDALAAARGILHPAPPAAGPPLAGASAGSSR